MALARISADIRGLIRNQKPLIGQQTDQGVSDRSVDRSGTWFLRAEFSVRSLIDPWLDQELGREKGKMAH